MNFDRINFKKIKQSFNNLKIHNKIIFLITFSITILLVITGLFSFSISSQIVNKQINYNLTSSVQQISDNLDTYITNIVSYAGFVYQDRQIQKYLANENAYSMQECNDYIRPKLSSYGVASTYLFSHDGRVYGYNINFTNTDYNYKDSKEYKLCKVNNEKFIWMTTNNGTIGSEFYPDNVKDMFYIASIIKDFDSMNEVGLMLMTFRESDIFSIYNKFKMTENSYGFIIDSSGKIVSHQNKSLLGKKSEMNSIIEKNTSESPNGKFSYKSGNKEFMVIYSTLTSTKWKLIYVIPYDDILKNINLMKNMFLIIMIGVLIIAFVLAYIISKSISKPIVHIISQMDSYGKGNLSTNIVDYRDRTDEVGVLANEFNKMITQINNLIKNNYRNEIKKKEAEIKALEAQINPHFLYNTLDCINFMARKYKAMDISKMAICLGDLMRVSIRKDINMITIKDELSYIQNYMDIQKIRYGDKLSLIVDVDTRILDAILPKLILQPIIENAIVHGIEEKVGNGTITIHGYNQNDLIVVEVTDDGIGFNDEEVKRILKNNLIQYENMTNNALYNNSEIISSQSGNNIGVMNVDMRLKILYGKDYGVNIKTTMGVGTKVTITFPCSIKF